MATHWLRFAGFLLSLLIGGSSLRAQSPPTLQWQSRLGRETAYHNINSKATVYTHLHRIVVVGNRQLSNTNYASAMWLLSARGDSLRTTYYSYSIPGYTGVYQYGVYAAAEMSNADLLMAGSIGQTNSAGTFVYNYTLLRTDSLGVLRWVRTYSNLSTSNIYALQALPDGGALAVFSGQHPLGTPSNPVSVPTVIRFDSVGNIRWQRTYGQPYYSLRCITPLSDGSYVLAGNALTGPPQWQGNGWVLHIDLNGDTLRSRLPIYATFSAVAEAPGKGLVLGGVSGTGALVAVTDSLDQVQWQKSVLTQRPSSSANARFDFVRATRTTGQVLVAGLRPVAQSTNSTNYIDDYLALWQAPAAPGVSATAVWEQQRQLGGMDLNHMVPASGNALVVGGRYYDATVGQNDLRVSRLTNVPALYEPPLCRTPPEAHLGLVPDAGGLNFTVVDLSLAGPRYAQLVRWRWDWGDGSPVVEGPRPLGHSYAARVPGTAVRLTVTNNLGCVSTEVEYPFGLLPTRPAQLQAALTLHPNPATGVTVTVTLPGLAPQGPVAGEVVNSLGQVVQRLSLPVAALGQGASVEVGGLAAGVYALRLHPQEGAVTARLVKQ